MCTIFPNYNIEIEDELVCELRLLCDKNGSENKDNLSKTLKILHQLGCVYANKSLVVNDEKEINQKKVCLIQSAVLLNAALRRCRVIHPEIDDYDCCDIQSDIKTLCEYVLKLAGATSQVDLVLASSSIKEDILEMRKVIKKELLTLEQIPIDVFGEELHGLEEKKVEDLMRIQDCVTDMYTAVMQRVSRECVDALGDRGYKFALVGMGSLARKEVTPYSDFENIILVPNDVKDLNQVLEYFRWFAIVFQIILINLEETIIPSVCIPSLNNANEPKFSEYNWFYDQFTLHGICFDGLMPHACKFPLGRFYTTENRDFTTELIKTVDDMVKYLDSEEDLKNGYHLADVLTKTCFVYGDENIYKEFCDLSKAKLDQQRLTCPEFLKQLSDQVDQDKRAFETWKNLSNLHKNMSSNIKTSVYRVSTIFISALGKFYGVGGSSCFEVIKALQDARVTCDEDAHDLMYAVAIACEVRLRWYIKRGSQADSMQKNISTEGYDTKLFDLIGEKSTLDYFDIVHSLHEALPDFMERKPDRIILRKVAFTKPAIYFFLHEYRKSIDSFRAELKESRDDNDNKIYVKFRIGYALFYLEKYREAIEEFEDTLALLNQLPSSKSNESKLKKTHIALADCYRCIKEYNKALTCYNQAPVDVKDDIELNNRGVVYLKLCEYGQARKYFEDSIEVLKAKSTDKKELALLIHNVGRCFYEQGDYKSALKKLEKSYNLRRQVLTDDGPDQNLAGTLYNIGRCHLGLGELEKATSKIEESMEMLKQLPAGIATDLSIADNFHYLGQCKLKECNYTEALSYFKEEKERRTKVDERQEIKTKDEIEKCSRCIEDCLLHLQ